VEAIEATAELSSDRLAELSDEKELSEDEEKGPKALNQEDSYDSERSLPE
jgi:hypothetical protein